MRLAALARRSGRSRLGLALAAPALAAGFVVTFDAVMLVTTWQRLKHGAVALAQDSGPDAGGGMEGRFDRARMAARPLDLERSGGLALMLLGPGGALVAQWQRGEPVPPPPTLPAGLSGCAPHRAFVATVSLPPSDWLVAPALVRAVVPVLRATALSCSAEG